LAVLTFPGLSGDSFAALAPLLIDLAPSFRAAALAGVLGAVSLMAASAAALSRRSEWIGLYVMIAAGSYILADTGTDLI